MKCNMPIDWETKAALAGAALEAALKDPASPRCGQELSGDDVFCPACGARLDNTSLQGTFASCNSNFPAMLRLCKGRAPRGELWMVWLIAAMVWVMAYGVAFSIFGNAKDAASVYFGKTVLAIAGFMIGICTLPVAVRRLHDRGNSGKAMIPSVCLSFVSTVLVLTGNTASITGSSGSFACALVDIMAAAYNLFLFVALGFIRGTRGPNKYGPDPLETK